MDFKRNPTNQDISWFLDLHKQKQLDLEPPYQRKSVWTLKDRMFLLDTIFNGYPIPSIFLNKVTSKDGNTIYHVIDGKQRLETIFMFTRGEIKIARDFGDIALDGKTWDQLTADSKQKFWGYEIPVEMISFSETDLINQVFERLNRNSRKLTAQELRHAKFDGWIANFVEDEISNPIWRDIGLITTREDKRMAGVQRLSELLFVILEGKIIGFDQDEIDRLYAKYDEMDGEDSLENPLENMISTDEFQEKFEYAKSFLLEMESENNVISTYAKTMANIYTLWSVIVLNRNALPDPAKVANKYAKFMSNVAKVKDHPDLKTDLEIVRLAKKYRNNSLGASTDLKQRLERHDVLLEAINGTNEDSGID